MFNVFAIFGIDTFNSQIPPSITQPTYTHCQHCHQISPGPNHIGLIKIRIKNYLPRGPQLHLNSYPTITDLSPS